MNTLNGKRRSIFAKRSIKRGFGCVITAETPWRGISAVKLKLCPPATMADVQRAKDAATADACRVTLAIFFTALLDKEGMEAEQLQRIWREVEALSESVRDGYVSAPDLIRVLREEYEIDIVGG